MASVKGSAIFKDMSISAGVAGFVTILVGFTSAGVIVFQAATALGATASEISSWFWSLGLGMGLTTLGFSLLYRVPVITAWSTPGAALLITAAAEVSLEEATAGFLISAGLVILFGFTGWFERMMQALPVSLASGMLVGVLFQFGVNVFTAMQTQFLMVFVMFVVYSFLRQLVPRYAVMAALLLGMAIAGGQGLLRLDTIQLQWATPVFTAPQFSLNALIGVALPLFVVTMASQNVPGVATIQAFGYRVPSSPLVGWTGVATLLLAPFGAFAINLAAITAAISMGQEAHEDPSKRYIAGVTVGGLYIVTGLLGATVTAFFTALPQELVLAIAGLALLGTIGNGLVTALGQETEREAALVTFLVTASGLTLLGIGAAFWGLVAGVLTLLMTRLGRQLAQT